MFLLAATLRCNTIRLSIDPATELPPFSFQPGDIKMKLFVTTINQEELTGETLAELRIKVRQYITDNCFGASDVGSRFEVDHIDLPSGACYVGYITYNGRFIAHDSNEAKAGHGGDAVILGDSI